MAAHRYWRLYITAGSSNYTSIKEVEFAQIGGADLCTGGTAIESSHYGTDAAANAFDNNIATFWAPSGAALPQWVGYDFGAGNAKDIQVVRLLQRDASQYPSAFNVQYSDDGSSWTTAWSVSGLTYVDALRPFPDPALSSGGKTLVRLRVTAADGNNVFTTGDLNFYEDGVDVTASGNYFAGSAVTDLAKVFDADTTTFGYGVTPASMGVEFSSVRNITGFSTTCRNWTAQALKDGVLEASIDGVSWDAIKTVTGETGWSLGETRTYSIPSGRTGTLAATESGSDTAALAGDVYVAGSLAATEAGADVASLAGGVLVQGALAATETGSDTAAITGVASVVSAGVLDAAESGTDAASVAGAVLVVGSFAATESGADVAALSGDVVVSGSLSATESGADAAALTGAVRVHGSLAATETGADTTSIVGAVVVRGALSATEAGSDAAGFSSSTTATGALSAAESGADSAAASGVVLVRGALGASEAADVAVLSGAVVVKGALSATEQGADVAAITGDVLARGALAATEVGSDTAAVIGDATPESIGALAVTETGSDSASATGVVRVRGSASITETDADSAIVVGKVFIAGTVAASEAEDTAAINGALVAPTISQLAATLTVRAALSARFASSAAISAGAMQTGPAIGASRMQSQPATGAAGMQSQPSIRARLRLSR